MALKEIEECEEPLIECIGVDNRKHVCKPYENKTMCGVDIRTKKLQVNDWKLYSCYPCTW